LNLEICTSRRAGKGRTIPKAESSFWQQRTDTIAALITGRTAGGRGLETRVYLLEDGCVYFGQLEGVYTLLLAV